MDRLPQCLFDVFALSLPRGHGFGDRPPVETWQSDDGISWGVVTRDAHDGSFSILVLRRRVDHLWTTIEQRHGFATLDAARDSIAPLLKGGVPPEPVPRGTAPRPALYDLQGRQPSDVFKLLTRPSHHVAAWLLHQVYLALPTPDKNWAGDCQTGNFHTRLWEAHLLASFREQGLLVTQPCVSPDFCIQNRFGAEAWVEAVTANPAVQYNHVGSEPSIPPADTRDRFLGPAALRFAKTLGNKLQRRYDLLPHVVGKPFVIALADFHAPGSMVWSREALIGYLYGMHVDTVEVGGSRTAMMKTVSHLPGDAEFPAGLFRNADQAELSAVVFTNACSISKFNRVGVSAGAATKGLRYVRYGKLYDRTLGALEGIPFCLDVAGVDYRALWPQGYEPWSAELEVFHNPFARAPLPQALLPEATHWKERDGEVMCQAHYETSVLWSRTLIQDAAAPMPSWADLHEPTGTDA